MNTAASGKFDGWRVFFIVLFVVVFGGGAVGLSYLSVHLGWFKSWQDLAWVVGIGGICLAAAALPSSQTQAPQIAQSKWATRADIAQADVFEWTPEGAPEGAKDGVYLGTFADERGAMTLRYKGGKHLLTFGTPGANKSTGLVIPNLAHLPRSIIVIDPKGELAAITARKRAMMGRVIVLNPFGLFVDRLPHLQSNGWNPLLQLDADPESDNFESDAHCIADALIDKAGGGNGKFFEASAQNLVAGLVMWERYFYGEEASLGNIRAVMCEPNEYDADKKLTRGFLMTLQAMADCKHPAIKNAGARLYGRLTDPNSHATSAQDVIDTVLASTRFLDHPRMSKDMQRGGAIDFAALHREITTIYLILPADELIAQAKWLRLFVNLTLRKLYKSAPPVGAATLPPVLLMLDEFGNLGGLAEIENALNLSRGYRIQLWMFLQNLAQLKGNYKDKWESFFTGAGAVTSFKTGDMETAEQLAKIYGNEERYIPTQNPQGGVSNTPHAIPLIRPEDLNRLGQGETISLIEPCAMPFKGKAPVYPETRFADNLDPNPYFHG